MEAVKSGNLITDTFSDAELLPSFDSATALAGSSVPVAVMLPGIELDAVASTTSVLVAPDDRIRSTHCNAVRPSVQGSCWPAGCVAMDADRAPVMLPSKATPLTSVPPVLRSVYVKWTDSPRPMGPSGDWAI